MIPVNALWGVARDEAASLEARTGGVSYWENI